MIYWHCRRQRLRLKDPNRWIDWNDVEKFEVTEYEKEPLRSSAVPLYPALLDCRIRDFQVELISSKG